MIFSSLSMLADQIISYLVGSVCDREPALHHLAVEEVLGGDLHDADDLCVGVILVPHVEDEAVRAVAHLHLEPLVPLRVEAVVDHGGLGDPRLAQLHVHEGVGDVLVVVEFAEPHLHVGEVARLLDVDDEVAVEEGLPGPRHVTGVAVVAVAA